MKMPKKKGKRNIDGRTYYLVGKSASKAKANRRSDFLKGDRYMRIIKLKKGYGIYVAGKKKS